MKTLSALFLLTVLAISDPAAWCQLSEFREVHYQMGTLLDITIWHADAEEAKRIMRQAVQEVHRLEGIMSNYDPRSSLSSFNDQAGQGKIKIDPDLYRLLAIAVDRSAKTSGYFDVTVGPLIELWKQSEKKNSAPDSHALASAAGLVGYWNLKLNEASEAELIREGMNIDLGGIGKGYAVDRIIEMLKRAGVKTALINFGGSSIYALGSPPAKTDWEIAVKGINEKIVGILHLKNQALSTSGSMGHSWNIGGKRYGHLINPNNGWPVTVPRVATVVAPTATEAEVWTKPLVILGKAGISTIKGLPQIEALLVSETGELSLSDGLLAKSQFQRIQTQ